MRRLLGRALALAIFSLALVAAGSAEAAPPEGEQAEPLKVAVKSAPPFSYQEGGEWTGISVELWRDIAAELELDYEFEEASLTEMIDGVAEGRYEVAVAALTVTAEREAKLDFTLPFYTTGLAIAVPSEHEPPWRGVLRTVGSWDFLQLIAVLALIQLCVGTLVWALERRQNPEQFPSEAARGVGSGFWWATVTMTTVGYGDKAPRSPLGRAVALLWMLASMVIIASVTATIASSLTVERLTQQIRGPEDLERVRVGVIRATTGANYLGERKLVYEEYATGEAALAALSAGEIDALVWDAPLLREAIAEDAGLGIELVGAVFQRQDYAIAVGTGSELREAINRVLPDKVRALDY
ncbi:transporter substrate-binding domain-containing protein [Pseudenhygromyxa sp. WMMC2535]|uniref:transporter substrate-binding domain-containing protein n=1 Tax=Pseudenhygromyxa sp. WMMC2535 TaxID=2712867 RepID=UPI0015522F59|nr:transporter substrate-binding domain-containing protein [Pseudenhygromyxa sp. WMMC2535]NVB39535.1 transporter substrate-binding domain-containing protein [Pseudenhygromyxa sp. WMMC2535]